MAILDWPGCDRGGLRVPDGRRGKVTCPRCSAEWFYPESVEVSEVEFRCSSSGARFVVVLSRRSPLHLFVIQAVKNAAPRPKANAMHEEKQSATELIKQTEPNHPLLPPRKVGWLGRITGLKGPAAPPGPPDFGSALTQATENQPQVSTTYEAKYYNWSSFFCPYCQASSFVKCGGGHLACDGTVEIRNGRRFRQCFVATQHSFLEQSKTLMANNRL